MTVRRFDHVVHVTDQRTCARTLYVLTQYETCPFDTCRHICLQPQCTAMFHACSRYGKIQVKLNPCKLAGPLFNPTLSSGDGRQLSFESTRKQREALIEYVPGGCCQRKRGTTPCREDHMYCLQKGQCSSQRGCWLHQELIQYHPVPSFVFLSLLDSFMSNE